MASATVTVDMIGVEEFKMTLGILSELCTMIGGYSGELGERESAPETLRRLLTELDARRKSGG